MSYEVIIDISDVERRSFDFKRMFDESIPCKERIVRCCDCKWFTPEETYEEYRDFAHSEIMVEPPSCGNPERCNNYYDSATGEYVPVCIVTQPDGYCSWGKRRAN